MLQPRSIFEFFQEWFQRFPSRLPERPALEVLAVERPVDRYDRFDVFQVSGRSALFVPTKFYQDEVFRTAEVQSLAAHGTLDASLHSLAIERVVAQKPEVHFEAAGDIDNVDEGIKVSGTFTPL